MSENSENFLELVASANYNIFQLLKTEKRKQILTFEKLEPKTKKLLRIFLFFLIN